MTENPEYQYPYWLSDTNEPAKPKEEKKNEDLPPSQFASIDTASHSIDSVSGATYAGYDEYFNKRIIDPLPQPELTIEEMREIALKRQASLKEAQKNPTHTGSGVVLPSTTWGSKMKVPAPYNGLIKKTKVCKTCGSEEVATLQWKNINNSRTVYHNLESPKEMYCLVCQCNTEVVRKEDFKPDDEEE